jgi:hypothetical protein
LRRVLRNCLDHCHGSRTHLALDEDAPESSEAEFTDGGKVVALPTPAESGGFPHRRA